MVNIMYPTRIASRTVTLAAGAVQDDDGIKTSFATVTSPVTIVPADFNGAVVSSSTGFITGLARVVTITRSNNAAQFSVVPIVMTYVRGGQILTESLTPANANGNDVLAFNAAVEKIISIAFPAQGGTGGTFKVGVRDVCALAGDSFVGVELAAAGTLYVQYGEAASAPTDAIVIPSTLIGSIKPICPTRILTDTTKTTVGFTVYLP
jgi:hypothetical protein